MRLKMNAPMNGVWMGCVLMSIMLGCGELPEEGTPEHEADQIEQEDIDATVGESDEDGISKVAEPDAAVEGDWLENNDVDPEERTYKRLHRDPRQAIKLEAFYALSKRHNGGSRVPKLRGFTVSDWNYLNSDRNAYNRTKNRYGCYASMWTRHGSCGGSGGYKRMGNNSYYDFPQNYGFFGARGRGGQCVHFAELIVYRSGVRFDLPDAPFRALPSYTSVRNDFNGRRRYTKPAHQVRVGDVLYSKWSNGHVAVAVQILRGHGGHNVQSVDVIDSNYVTWGPGNEEIIGRHPIKNDGRGLGDLDNYIAVDVTRHLRE